MEETTGIAKFIEIFVDNLQGWNEKELYYVDYDIDVNLPAGLALSGGGFRATMFHLGALNRLNEMGILRHVDTITSVSGGSIINGILASAWDGLVYSNFSTKAFDLLVRRPARMMCDEDFGLKTVFLDNVNPKVWFKEISSKETSCNRLAERYAEAEAQIKETLLKKFQKEYEEANLVDFMKPKFRLTLSNALPVPSDNIPLFIFCGCDMRDGQPFFFTQKLAGKEIGGPTGKYLAKFDVPESECERLASTLSLAESIAGSSAFPLALQPLVIQYKDKKGKDMDALITDGGVYDNLGLDPLFSPNPYIKNPYYGKGSFNLKNNIPHQVMFVSNAGAPLSEKDHPSTHFPIFRALGIVGSQTSRLRSKLMKNSFQNNAIYGAIWQLDDLWRYYYMFTAYIDPNHQSIHSSEAEKKSNILQVWRLKQLGIKNKLMREIAK